MAGVQSLFLFTGIGANSVELVGKVIQGYSQLNCDVPWTQRRQMQFEKQMQIKAEEGAQG